MKLAFTVSALAIVALSGGVSANTVEVEISQTIANPVTGFPEGYVADSTGVAIGMSADEVRAVFSERPVFTEDDLRYKPDTRAGEPISSAFQEEEQSYTFGMSDGPFEVNFSSTLVALSSQKADAIINRRMMTEYKATGDTVTALFGSGFTGGKVQIVRSGRVFDEPVDLEALKSAVVDKYGEPHLIKEGRSWLSFHYGFVDGAPLPSGDMRADSRLENCSNGSLYQRGITVSSAVGVMRIQNAGAYFSNMTGSGLALEACDAGLTVIMSYGDVPTVAKSIVTDIVDNVAIAEDIEEFSRVGNGELEKLRNSVSGTTEVPKL